VTPAELSDMILRDVTAALLSDSMDADLRAIARTAYEFAYEDIAAGDPDGATFLASIDQAITATEPNADDDAQPERISKVIATAATNAAVVAAAPDGASFEWITMLDDAVRDIHRPLHGEVRAAGDPFIVGGQPLLYPGQPVGPPEVWINCRCTLNVQPMTAAAPQVDDDEGASAGPPPAVPALVAATPNTGIAMVAKPSDPERYAVEGGLPPDELHATLGYFGTTDDPALDPELRARLEQYLADAPLTPHAAKVGGVGVIGDDDPPACVLLLESDDLAAARGALETYAPPDRTHPHFTPHMTLGYGTPMPEDRPAEVALDHNELWWGDERISAPMTASADSLVAREFDTGKRKAMAKRHTAMPDGSFPIANAEDLHNAIQAIGRAKDPDAVKAHIRRRAKALGLESQLPDSWSASAEVTADATENVDYLEAWPKSTSPPGTHDAPGWLTHPRETQRLRNYWTKGAGAAKIRWGSPGDLTRCARHLGKYVGPQYAWGTCQNLHHTVFGFYNPESRGRKGGGDPDEIIDAIDAAFTAAAELEDDMDPTMLAPPLEWFQDPGFDAATPLTITSDGRVLGHLAAWETCHVGITGECVKPPKSKTGYAHFRTGEVETREGELVAVGQITMDTGHAGKEAGPQDTVSHYDNTGTGVADVAAGEDEYGIWVAGAMRPGVSEQQMYALKATGALSGDWRRIGGNLELVAALAVNVPGFPIPRLEMAASVAGAPLSLVAAAVVTPDPNSLTEERIVVAVGRALDNREAARARALRAAALNDTLHAVRAQRLMEVAAGKIPPQFLKNVKGEDAEDACGPQRDGESDDDYSARMAKCEEGKAEKAPEFASAVR
jgi:hypothetical protein